jgi:NADPH:quinone reductase-like Zn-dependent oxidoreductase
MTTKTYRAVQVSKPGRLEVVERELTAPPPGKARIRVEARSVRHPDALTVEGVFLGVRYPRVPGPEAVGTIDALGAQYHQAELFLKHVKLFLSA